jgi:2-polyprenyl-6-hydroxyphenyl methylase/3-demethylubiquinone-9 3-methyltransferase
VLSGERFEFGTNWASFLRSLSPEQIANAELSLRTMLGRETLRGLRFLDIGSGSGLFSLAARRLGAEVVAFDFDPTSVRCTRELRNRYFAGDDRWRAEEGSVLDVQYLAGLGQFDIVYSWGVLHHTGEMWTAIANAAARVAPDGQLFLALYNDQGPRSRRWRAVKRLYNRMPRVLRPLYIAAVMAPIEIKSLAAAVVRRRLVAHLRARLPSAGASRRGMNYWRDVVDWIGGYPFEVAKPEEVFSFLRDRGFRLTQLTTVQGYGCNQFVFRRESATKVSSG